MVTTTVGSTKYPTESSTPPPSRILCVDDFLTDSRNVRIRLNEVELITDERKLEWSVGGPCLIFACSLVRRDLKAGQIVSGTYTLIN